MKKFIITLLTTLFISTYTWAEDINVAFTIDNNYPIYTLLAINSILQNNKSNSNYNFYIVENNLTDKNKKKMADYVRERNQNIEFINIDTSKIDDGNNFFGFLGHITPIGMARILLPELLSEDVHKIIYLDGDILVTEDLKDLFDIDLGDLPAGLALNISTFESVDIYKLKGGYYNSGVILLDLDKWRKENISQKMLAYLKNNKDKFIYKGISSNVFLYPDQDLINIMLEGRIKDLPQNWNNQTIRGVILEDMYSYGIIHYIGGVKPWNYPAQPDKYFKLYYEYWNTSGLRMYKFYYASKSVKNIYKDICDYKIKRFTRFKNLLYNLAHKFGV